MIEPPASPAPASPWVPAAIAGCTLIWGSTFLFISVGNDTLPPIWAAALRLALASGVLFALTVILRQPLPRGPALKATLWFGLLQFGANFPLLYWAEKSVPSGLAAIVFATIPLQAALLAWRLGLERFSWARIVGGAVALTGIALMFGGELKTRPDPRPLVAVIAATLCANVASLLYKKGPHQPAIPANAVGAALGSVICLGLSRITGEHAIAPPTIQSWGALLYLTFAGSVGAFVLWTWLVNRVPVTRIAFIGVTAPLIALMLGVLVRHEQLTALSVTGAVIVLVGLAIGLEIGMRRKGSGTGRA